MQGSGGEDSPPRTESIAEPFVHGPAKPKSPIDKPEEFIKQKVRRRTPMKKRSASIDSPHAKTSKQPKSMKVPESLIVADDSLAEVPEYQRNLRNDIAARHNNTEDFGSFDKTTTSAPPSTSSSPKKETSKKRDRDADDSDDADPSPQELAQMSRSERKKFREKKRRSEVNKGFDDLMALLLEIDPEVRSEAEERARRGQWKGALGAHEENLLNRVDLIGRTVKVLSRLNRENEQRKLIIDDLTRGNAAAAAAARNAASNEQVSMMMPMMSSSDAAARMSRMPPNLQDSSHYIPGLLAQASLASSAQLGFPHGDFLGFGGPQGVTGLSSLTGSSNNVGLGGASGLSSAMGGASGLAAALGSVSSNLPAEYLRLLQQRAQQHQQSGSGASPNGRGAMGQRYPEGRGL